MSLQGPGSFSKNRLNLPTAGRVGSVSRAAAEWSPGLLNVTLCPPELMLAGGVFWLCVLLGRDRSGVDGVVGGGAV